MPATLRRLVMAAAAVVAAAAIYIVLTLPPRALSLDGPIPSSIVFGAYHVHSVRSDGTGTIDEIAEAAAEAGLSFVIVTDHGDATREPDPPTYLDGVLVIDAVEVNTDGGHVVALGLAAASPYPLAGRPADVIDDIHRQGGWVVVAHPNSERPSLRWWAGQTDQDAVEWLNADSEWRDDTTVDVVLAGARSLFRSAEAVASLFDRPVETLNEWDRMTRSREIVGLAGADAHGGIPRRGVTEHRSWVRVPSYGAMFRAIAQGVELEDGLSGDARADSAAILSALLSGRTFSIIHGLAKPAVLEFTASDGSGEVAHMGGRIDEPASPVVIRARVPQAPGIRLVLRRQGEEVARGRGSVEYSGPFVRGAYRVEAEFPGATAPWIISNPIYLGAATIPSSRPEHAVSGLPGIRLEPDDRWSVEHDRQSTGRVVVEDDGLAFTFSLGPGASSGQYAALVAPVGLDEGFDRVLFTAVADRPMRVSLQLRLPGGRDGLRWIRSVYVGTEPTDIVVRVEDLQPVGRTTSQQPIVARIQSLLFVVDTVNTLPGTSGRLRISNVELGVGDVSGEVR